MNFKTENWHQYFPGKTLQGFSSPPRLQKTQTSRKWAKAAENCQN
jgi:hypothetical protein